MSEKVLKMLEGNARVGGSDSGVGGVERDC